MKIFVVLSETVDYEDSRTWMVKGFFDNISARKYAQKCVIAAERYESKLELLERKYFRWRLIFAFASDCEEKTEFDTINEYDPYFDPNCENEYHVEPLEVEGKLYWGSHLERPCLDYTGSENIDLAFDPQSILLCPNKN